MLARTTGEALWDGDLVTGVWKWDGATEALFGYRSPRGRTRAWWEERIHPEDRTRVLAGLACTLDGPADTWENEYRFRRADGSYGNVLDRGVVVRDGTGKPVRMVGSTRAVARCAEHDDALHAGERLLEVAFEAAGVGMAHAAPDGSWLRINGKLAEITGYPKEELLGLAFGDITHPDDLARDLEHARRPMAGEVGGYSAEKRYVRRDGRRVWVHVTVSSLRSASGEVFGYVTVVEDITERKLAELVPEPLTPREVAVLRLVARGCTNPQIAASLVHSLGTVKLDLHRAVAKLGASNRRNAATRAIEIGLIAPAG